MTLRLLEQLRGHADATPEREAVRLVESGAALSFRELHTRVHSVAAHFAHHVQPGGVVLIRLPNRPEFTVAFLACLAAGLRAFPVSPELAAPELTDAVTRSGAAAVVATPDTIDLLGENAPIPFNPDAFASLPPASALQRSADTAGLLLLSSGTTGRPKIVFRDAKSVDAVSQAMAEAIGFGGRNTVLASVPLCHSYGLEHGLLAPMWAGSNVQLLQGFDLSYCIRQLSFSELSIFPGVPFMFEMLARHARDGATFPGLRRAYSAGGPLPGSVAQAFAERFGVPVTQLYGATEIGSVTYADPDLPGFNPASVGRPMTGVDVRVLSPEALDVSAPLPAGEQGHVAVRAASMLRNYLGEPELPTRDGYFLTGDLGRVDAHGNLTITGRIKLLIDVGGLKVNPVEVEDVLAQHPGVASCVVVPLRASETVARLKAIVTPRDGVRAEEQPTPASLRAFARARLAGYKVPRAFELRDSLPTSPTGKILRHLVEA